MGSARGFMDFHRKAFVHRSVKERVKDYNEVMALQNDVEIKRQAARCMECEISYCMALGCPLANRIPEWNDMVLRGELEMAYEALSSTASFPEFTGRVCPALCECACSLAIDLSAVTIKQIELYIIEKAFAAGIAKPKQPETETGRHVAIVGSGPAGLSAARELRKLGHRVTVYEKDDKPGGLLRYGIPDFKLPKTIIDRRIRFMHKEGIEFRTGAAVGETVSMNELMKHDAVLLAIGAGVPRDLPVQGRNARGIHFALEYLCQSNKQVAKELDVEEMIHAKGRNVLVIGGGDTGSDCIGTANRQGAASVTQIEIMPMPQVFEHSYNPNWPDYPFYLRTSTSHEEGCKRLFGVSTKGFLMENGQVTGAECVQVEWNKGEDGRMSMHEIPGSSFVLKAELVLLSMGFLHVEHASFLRELGVQFDERGNIRTDVDSQTSRQGVFAAGDAASGASLVVRAIAQGKNAAMSIDRYLSQK